MAGAAIRSLREKSCSDAPTARNSPGLRAGLGLLGQVMSLVSTCLDHHGHACVGDVVGHWMSETPSPIVAWHSIWLKSPSKVVSLALEFVNSTPSVCFCRAFVHICVQVSKLLFQFCHCSISLFCVTTVINLHIIALPFW